jgi:hypothetical protein
MHLDKLYRVADDDVTAMRLKNLGPAPKTRTMSDAELLRKGLSRQLERQPHSTGSADPSRRVELGEAEIDLGSSGKHRIRVAHDPENGAMHLHGVAITMAQVDKELAESFATVATRVSELQGTAEQASQTTLLSLVVNEVMRRHKFAADAVTRQLRNGRYGV